MNYVLLTSTNAWGGIERKLVMLANKLVEKGHGVRLLLLRGGVVPYPEAVDPRITIERIPQAPWNLWLVSAIKRRLQRIEQPVLIFFKLGDAHFHPRLRQALPGVPALFVISSTLSKGLNGNARRKDQVVRALMSMDKLICVSHGVSHHIRSHYGIPAQRVEVIHNPLIDAAAPPATARCDHPWLQEERPSIPVFITAGRLVDAKDYPNLIRAFAIVRQKQECRLIILGEGIRRPQLEALVDELGLQQSVSLPGFIDHPVTCFRRASVFVLSSRNEGLGNVLVEALQSGIPIVSTDCPNGPAEVLEQGKLGILVPPRDTQALAGAMQQALTTPAPAAEQLAESLLRFDADRICERYIEAVRSITPASAR